MNIVSADVVREPLVQVFDRREDAAPDDVAQDARANRSGVIGHACKSACHAKCANVVGERAA